MVCFSRYSDFFLGHFFIDVLWAHGVWSNCEWEKFGMRPGPDRPIGHSGPLLRLLSIHTW